MSTLRRMWGAGRVPITASVHHFACFESLIILSDRVRMNLDSPMNMISLRACYNPLQEIVERLGGITRVTSQRISEIPRGTVL